MNNNKQINYPFLELASSRAEETMVKIITSSFPFPPSCSSFKIQVTSNPTPEKQQQHKNLLNLTISARSSLNSERMARFWITSLINAFVSLFLLWRKEQLRWGSTTSEKPTVATAVANSFWPKLGLERFRRGEIFPTPLLKSSLDSWSKTHLFSSALSYLIALLLARRIMGRKLMVASFCWHKL